MNMSTNKYQPFLFSTIFIFYTTLSHCSLGSDTLSQGQTLKDGHTLLSTREIFELGFFTPGNSTHRYIGIWYYNFSVQTVIWVANRKTPLTNSGGSLTFGSDGNLVLLNDQGNILWSTNLSVSSTTNSSVTAQILDMGKLVVLSGNQTVIWDSFDHPTDTFLPGMKIILDPKNGIRTLFTSWKSPNDPSVGKYSMGLDSSGSGQLFVYKGRRPRWRSGQFDGTQFIGSTMRPIYLYGFKIVISQGSMYATYEQFNSTLLRFVLQRDGVENTSMLVDDTKEWETVGVQPGNECETYGKCHNYGICSESSTASICSCLKGFEPRFGEEWNKGNWSGGCVRRTPLVCESNNNSNSTGNKGGDGFYRYQAVKVPDLSEWASLVTNEADCRSACSNNCSCKAYAYVAGIGCLMWARDLIDIAQFPQGSGTDLYIKLAASELGTKRKIWKVIVIVCASVIFLLIVCVLLWCKFNAFLKDLCKKRHEQQNSLPGSGEGRIDLPGSNETGEGEEGKDAELPLFHFESLVKATNNFDDANKLGEGGFGAVYKGLLPGGQEVAVKRLSRSSGQGQEEFKNEMSLIAKLQHRNLVRLLGFCIQGDEKILIYEYMPNKSLDVLLFDPTRQQLLNWNGRFRIIEGIARGLVYLHRDSRLRIVHRDLKASNILLDGAMNPKISDFGIARIFGGDENQLNTNRVVGTFGYMSPEYAMEGLFSVKSDVYSFGVLVLEIVTGRRNNSFHDMDDTINIVGYAWQLWTEDKANEMIDPAILDPGSVDQIVKKKSPINYFIFLN